MTKKLTVTIKLEMEVPDHWELAMTSDGIKVLKTGDKEFMEMTFMPIFTDDMDGTWSSSDDDVLNNDIIGMVEQEDVTYRFATAKSH